MRRLIARRRYERGLRALEHDDLDSLMALFTTDCRLVFLGDTPLGADLRGEAEVRTWFERFCRLMPQRTFEIRRLQVTGWPWRLHLTAHVVIRAELSTGAYENQFAHFLDLRGMRVANDLVLEDTQRWAGACRDLVSAGIAEAGAAPMR